MGDPSNCIKGIIRAVQQSSNSNSKKSRSAVTIAEYTAAEGEVTIIKASLEAAAAASTAEKETTAEAVATASTKAA